MTTLVFPTSDKIDRFGTGARVLSALVVAALLVIVAFALGTQFSGSDSEAQIAPVESVGADDTGDTSALGDGAIVEVPSDGGESNTVESDGDASDAAGVGQDVDGLDVDGADGPDDGAADAAEVPTIEDLLNGEADVEDLLREDFNLDDLLTGDFDPEELLGENFLSDDFDPEAYAKELFGDDFDPETFSRDFFGEDFDPESFDLESFDIEEFLGGEGDLNDLLKDFNLGDFNFKDFNFEQFLNPSPEPLTS